MRTLAPYLKAGGKISGYDWLEKFGVAAENLPPIPADHRKLQEEIGPKYSPARVDIELRNVLTELITKLDADRSPKQKIGGLHKWLNDDGRVLWLCPTHYKPLQSRLGLSEPRP